MTERKTQCLLLVEDDELVRMTVAMMLDDEGYGVVEASDALQALALVKDGLAADVVVTDVDLGSGPSGTELADELLRIRPTASIIFITGRLASVAGRTLGPREVVLPKPFETQRLSALIRRVSTPPSLTEG